MAYWVVLALLPSLLSMLDDDKMMMMMITVHLRAPQPRCDRRYNDKKYMEITQFTIIMGNSVVFECCVTLLKYLTASASPANLEPFYLSLIATVGCGGRGDVVVVWNVPFVIYFSVCRSFSHSFSPICSWTLRCRWNFRRWMETMGKKYACESWTLAAAAAPAKQFSSHKS